MTASVSVVIPVRDDPLIVDCVASVLARRGEARELQVIVVDNCSAPQFERRLADLEGVTLIREPSPGPYAARNAGLRAAEGERIFFTDADCVVQPGWIARGLEALDGGADVVRGYSGSRGGSVLEQLLQRRYEAHLRPVAAGAPTECDTRNMAVSRAVFDRLQFNQCYRRVSDTEFGLRAEAAGFRVAYCPEMAVEHLHDPDLQLFVVKQVCHGWGAQRLMQSHPGLPWHSGHLRTAERLSEAMARVPWRSNVAAALIRASIACAGGLQRIAPKGPAWAAAGALIVLDKAAGLAGHLMFEPGSDEPSPSRLLHRPSVRD